MTSLLVKPIQTELPSNLSSLTAMARVRDRDFYEFCRTNPDLRIERSANGEIIVRLPAFSDTGDLNGRIFGQLYIWSEADGMEEYMANGVRIGLLVDRKSRQVHVYRLGYVPEILNNPEEVSCEPEMPRFELKLAKIW